jgi:nucleotide-binding universal stress UspA family protein
MTILAGFLPTPEGEAAFAAGLDEARRRGEDLVVLNSARSGAPVSAEVAAPELIEDLRARAKAVGVTVDVRQGGHAGDAADEVLRVAEELNASVIVIGLRRRSPVGKFLLGSNAQRVLLGADRPVLAVKPAGG